MREGREGSKERRREEQGKGGMESRKEGWREGRME